MEHAERLRVAWVDTDAGGRIHFTAVFRWAEFAETGLRRSLGLMDDWGNYPRRRVEAEYHKVLRFEDEIEIRIRPERVGTTSVTYGWRILRGDELCVDGRHTVVHVGSEGMHAVPLPHQVRSRLTELTTESGARS